MDLFFDASLTPSSTFFMPTPEEAKHLLRTMRAQNGDLVYLTNGKGGKFKAEIENDNFKTPIIKIIEIEQVAAITPSLCLFLPILKSEDRLEWAIEKAIEIGVNRIQLYTSAHTAKNMPKPDRLQRLAIAALKQSHKYYLPEIVIAQPFSKLVEQAKPKLNYLAHCYEMPKAKLSELQNQDCNIWIGPEADFSLQEVELAIANNFQTISLGDYRLRAETAAIVACTLFRIS